MQCKNDSYYCPCKEHQAYWDAWAKQAITPVVKWLSECEPEPSQMIAIETAQDAYARIEAESELTGFEEVR